MNVRDFVRSRAITYPPQASLSDAASLMREHRQRHSHRRARPRRRHRNRPRYHRSWRESLVEAAGCIECRQAAKGASRHVGSGFEDVGVLVDPRDLGVMTLAIGVSGPNERHNSGGAAPVTL